jgi:nitroreductase
VELSETIASRRSIRKFKEKDISDETIRVLLEAARLAPSGSNLQPWRFVVVKSPAAKEALGQFTMYKFIVKASVVFVCYADLTAMTAREQRLAELFKEGCFEGVDIDMTDPSLTAVPAMDKEAVRGYLSMNVAIAVSTSFSRYLIRGLAAAGLPGSIARR